MVWGSSTGVVRCMLACRSNRVEGTPVSTEAHERVHDANGKTEDIEAPPDPGANANICGGSCDPPADDVSAGTFDLGFSQDGRSDPEKDVVLRIEAETEAETKVCKPHNA